MFTPLRSTFTVPIVASSFLVADLAHAAAPSAPATQQSLDDLFQVQDIAATVSGFLKQPQAHPGEVAAFLQERFTWEDLKPMVTSAYRGALSQEDVDALLVFYDTPAGKLCLSKLQPVSIAATKALARHFDACMDAIFDRADSKRPKVLGLTKFWIPGNAHERAAGELATLLMKDAVDARLGQMEQTILDALRATQPDAADGKTREQAGRYAKLIRHELTFEAFKPVVVQELLAQLSPEEMQTLLESENTAERKQLRARLTRAEGVLQTSMEIWMKSTLVPALLQFLAKSS